MKNILYETRVELKGFLDLRDFINLEYLLLENVPKIKGWDLSGNVKLSKIVFSNSDFNREEFTIIEKQERWEGEIEGLSGNRLHVKEENLPRNFPGGRYFSNPENAYDPCLKLELSFLGNPELTREGIEIIRICLQGVTFNLPTKREKELQKQLDERISPEELAELLQTQIDLQTQLEEKERENKLLREQLEEVLQRNEQEQLAARIEIPSQNSQ